MKVLVATRRSQGDREGDYMHGVPGELVWIPPSCDADLKNPANGCGCTRGFGGLSSHKAMTTVEVVESHMTPEEVRVAFEVSLRDQGWIPPGTPSDVVEEILAETMVDILSHAEAFPLGALIRRDGDRVYF